MASNETVVLGNKRYTRMFTVVLFITVRHQGQIKCTSSELVKYIMCCFAAIEKDVVALF